MNQPKKILILGGGISGLTLAYRLNQKMRSAHIACDITVLEASPRFGGILETVKRDGFIMEAGADSFITDKPAALNLAHELGLADEVLHTNSEHRRSFILRQGILHPVPQGFYLIAPGNIPAFLNSSLLSLPGKLRVLLEPLIGKGHSEDESVENFITRRFGREAYEKIGQAMIGGIYSGDAAKLSMKAAMPKLWEMEKNFGSVIKGVRSGGVPGDASTSGPHYGLFVSFKEGLQTLPDALVKSMPEVHLFTGKKVTHAEQLRPSLDKLAGNPFWKVTTSDGDLFQADMLCSALPAAQNAAFLKTVNTDLAHALSEIRHESAVTLNLISRSGDFPNHLKGFGFVVPQREASRLVGCTFSSLKWKNRAPQGSQLVRAFLGGAFQRDFVQNSSDRELILHMAGVLKKLLGFNAVPELSEIKRYRQAMPQYEIGHLKRAERIRNAVHNIENFHLLSNTQGGVGIPDRILEAGKIAERIVRELAHAGVQAARV